MLHQLVHRTRCISSPNAVGRLASNRSRPLLHVRPQVQAHRAHVAGHLAQRLLEGEVQAAFSPRARLDRPSGLRCWSCRCPRFPKPARLCRGNSLPPPASRPDPERRWRTRSLETLWCRPSDVTGSTEMPSASIRNGYSLVPCVGTAILDHPQPPRRDLLVDAVIQQDHAVRDIFFQPLPGQRAFAAFAGNHRRHALVFQPAEQPADFRPQNSRVREAGEQRLDRIQNHPLCLRRSEWPAAAG